LRQFTRNIQGIKVNGQFLSEAGGINYKGAEIPAGAYLLDLTTFPPGNKVIEIMFNDNPTSNGTFAFAVGDDEFVYPLELSNAFKIALEGDSITDMSSFSPLDIQARPETILGEWLGCQNIYNNCIGGSGLISTNSGTRTNFIQRLPDIVSFGPDLLIVNGCYNDSGSSAAAITAAAVAYLTEVRRVMPRCTIAVTGSHLLAGSSITTWTTMENALLAAVNQFADDNTFFIPILTAQPRLLNSTNGYMYPISGTPAWLTDAHPVAWYYYHIYRYIAGEVVAYYRDRARIV
jgi:hypothetical protein